MSMGIVLQVVRDRLRNGLSLATDQCDVIPGGEPPAGASELFVAIDERAVHSDARAHLREVFEIEVALWRRTGEFPADRAGALLLPRDPYLGPLRSLDALERAVIGNLHANYLDVVAAANALAAETSPECAGAFQLALYYIGRGRSEEYPTTRPGERPGIVRAPRREGDAAHWLGRRLRFAGLDRVQAVEGGS